MSPPDKADITATFEDAFHHIETGIKQAVDSYTQCVRTVEDNAIPLAPIVYFLREKLDAAKKALEKVIGLIQYAITHYTPTLSLIFSAFDWIDNVETPMSNLSAAAVTPRDENFRYWEGAAATAYHEKAAAQQGAIDDVVVKAKFISEWLFGIVQANVDYATELAGIVANIAGQFAQAASEAVTVIDIPWAISTLGSMVGTFVEEGINRLATVADRFTDALGDVRDIAAEVGDQTALPDGAWPQAIAG